MRCKRSYPQPFSSRPVARILDSRHGMASDSSAVVSTVVTKVEGEETCAGPPPYSEETSMEGKGVYCYKCHNYRTDSWYKLHTHLRCRCLNAKEKALLVNSYVHAQAKRELRLKARAQRRLREALDALTSATAVSPRTGVSYCLVLTSSTRPRGRSVRLSPRRGSARCRCEGARPLE